MDLKALGDMLGASAPMPTFNAEPVAGRVLHLDGDYAAYYCSGKDGTSPGTARDNVMSRIRDAKRATGATSCIVHLTHDLSTKGDRYLIAQHQPYQGQRDSGRKPGNWEHLREFMTTYTGPTFTQAIWSDREADDGMAYYSYNKLAATGEYDVVHTADKDMRMFPGLHLTWKTFETCEVPLHCFDKIGPCGKQYGLKWFWLQMLTGDSADHIPGIRNWGQVKAERLLRDAKDNEDAFKLVSDVYHVNKGEGWLDYFVEQAALLWMRVDPSALIDDFCRLPIGPAYEYVDDAARKLVHRVQRAKQALPVAAWTDS